MNAMVEKRKGEDFVKDNITPKSQADRIRAMSDEELAEFLDQFDSTCGMCIYQGGCYGKNCNDGILQWLKSEVKE